MSILFSAEDLFVVVGLQDLAAKMEERLGSAKKVKKYSSRNRLRRDMLTLNPAYEIFVSGSKSGSDKFFFCRVCHRDVGMKAQGAGEFARHFRSDGHWFRDVTYRVHMGLPVLNRLMEPAVEEIENAYGIDLQSSRESSPLCGRGTHYTSTKLARARKQPVLITREIPHCPRPWSTGYRGALSRPAPGRDFTCCGGIPQFTRGKGHGRATQH